MNQALRAMGITMVAGAIGLTSPALASCVREGPYEVVGCSGLGAGQPAFFGPEPGGTPADLILPTWWQLGYGNEEIDDPAGGAGDPTGGGWYTGDTYSDDLFIGNDMGAGDPSLPGGLDLRDAAVYGAPSGTTCLGVAASWELPGIDGCCDINRTYYDVGRTGDTSDEQLNPYRYAPPSPYTYTWTVDAPMGFLLREPTGTRFAAAFIRNRPRDFDPTDQTPGVWDLNRIVNGDPNPTQGGAPNVVPWQSIPRPDITVDLADPGDPSGSDRILSMTWTSILLVHDGSTLPATPFNDRCSGPMGCDNYGEPITGVGVLDQPQLATYVVQTKPVSEESGDCEGHVPWKALSGIIRHDADLAPHGISGLLVPHDSCVRLCTHLGRVPTLTFTPPVSKAERFEKQPEAQRGHYGDIGYDLCSEAVSIATLVIQRVNLIALGRFRGVVRVRFETTAEIDIASIEVVGFDQRGVQRVLQTVEPQHGNTGPGATYAIDVPRRIVRDTKQVQIVLQPSGEGSNLLEVR